MVHLGQSQEGDAIPELKKNCSTQQLVQWAAGSGDFYQIHYDPDFARGTGLDGHHRPRRAQERVPRPAAARLDRATAASSEFGCQYRGMDYPNQEIICRGVVTRKYEEDGKSSSTSTSGPRTPRARRRRRAPRPSLPRRSVDRRDQHPAPRGGLSRAREGRR